MRKDLLDWQWSLYPENHTRRLTLVVHVLSVPLFVIGWILIPTALLLGWEMAAVGVLFIVGTVASQGWAHKMEPVRPVPFDGPLDFVARFIAEQLVTFPRFLLSGKVASTWRKGG